MYVSGPGGRPERGQVAAIAAVLVLALVVVALALTQAVVVPQQNERIEFDHQQAVQRDMLDVRGAVLGSADTASGQTATVRLGTTYPERIFLQNPEPPQGSLLVEGIGTGSISNAVAVNNPETTDFWRGTSRGSYRNSRIVYDPAYNYYDDAPRSGYENSVLYRNRSGEYSLRAGQRLVEGRTLSLAFVEGDRSVSRTGTVTVQPRSLSASQVNVDLRSPNADPVTIRIPSRLPKSTWDELLAEEYDPSATDPDAYVTEYSCAATAPSEPCGTLTLRLEPGVTYDVKLSKVGLKGSTAEPSAYVTALRDPDPIDEGKTRQFTVQVRDRYNNPVSGVELAVSQPSTGQVVGPVNAVGEVGAVTDENGEATFTYRAPLNVPESGATATLGVTAPGIPGEKGRVQYHIGIQNTPEPADRARLTPLVTAVNPDVTDAERDAGGGDYVRVHVARPGGVDTTGYTVDLVNRNGSVRNSVALDERGLGVVGPTDLRTATASAPTTGAVYFVGTDDLGPTTTVDEVNAVAARTGDGTLPTTVDLNEITNGTVDLYVVGPNAYSADGASATDLRAFARHYGLDDDGEGSAEDDVVVRAGALGASSFSTVDFTAEPPAAGSRDTFQEADPNGDDDGTDTDGLAATKDVLDDRRGTVLLRDPPADVDGTPPTVVDAFAYRAGTPGRVTAVDPASPGGDSDDEHVRLDFDRPARLFDDDGANYTLSLTGDGRRETLDLGPVGRRLGDGDGRVTGPVYVVGDSVDVPTFAAENGVSPDRVVRAATLAGDDGLADGDVVPDTGGTATLRIGPPAGGEPVDEYEFDGVREASIGRVEPVDATAPAGAQGSTPTVSTDEYARLDFGTRVDTTAWTLTVDDGDGTVERLDLTPTAGTTARAAGPVYLLGQVDVDGDGAVDDGDRAAFADLKGVAPARVVFAADLATGDTANADVFDDDGASLTLLDVADERVDTYSYGSEPSPTIERVTPRDATRDAGATDEWFRLDFDRALDTTDWTLAIDDNDGTVERLDLGRATVRDVAGAGDDVYLVGGAVDPDRFAAERGLDPSQVVRIGDVAVGGLSDPDALDDDGATLRLTDARDRPVDAYSYENDALVDDVAGEDPSGGLAAGDRATAGDAVTGRIDTADPTDATAASGLGGAGDGDSDEYVRLSFPEPTDTSGWTLATSDGADLSLDAVAPQAGLGGPVYVVGDDLDVDDDDGDSDARDRRLFADAAGVSDARVYPASALTGTSEDVLVDGGETLALRNAGGVAVDVYTYEGDSAAGSGGALGASLPTADPVADGDGAREFVRLEFSRPLASGDLAGWTVTVSNRDAAPGAIDLSGLTDGGAADATGQRTVYLVGEGVDPATFAADRGLARTQVRRVSAVDSRFAGRNVLPDAAATLRLRDAGDAVRDRYDYRGLRTTDARIAGAVPLDATGDGPTPASADEYVRLSFPAPTDTGGWTLGVDGASHDATLALDDVDAPAGRGGSVYLVGGALDADGDGTPLRADAGDDIAAFADARGVSTDRVVRATTLSGATVDDPTDVIDDGGATLVLRDDAGVLVDSYTYPDATGGGETGTAAIADVTPASGANADGEVVEFVVSGNAPVEDGWAVHVDDGDDTLTAPLDDTDARNAFRSPGRTYLVGDVNDDGTIDGDDVSAVASREGVSEDRVLRTDEYVDAMPADGNVLPDAAGRVVLDSDEDPGNGAASVVDTYTYDDRGTASVTTVEPSVGDRASAEYARIDFSGAVDTDGGQGWRVQVVADDAGPGSSVDGNYTLSGTGVDDVASAGGPLYLVGEGLDADGDGTPLRRDVDDDIAAFAAAKGVSEARVVRFAQVRRGGSGDALPDPGGELRLQNGDDPRTTVDRAGWTGGGGARIDAVTPGGGLDEALRLEFPDETDTTGWTVDVDDADPTGGPGPVTLTLSGPGVDDAVETRLDRRTRDAEAVHVVGDYDGDGSVTTADADAYAADGADVARDQVFTTEQLGGPADAEVLADAGGTVTLRDATGDAVDTRVYGSELRSGAITRVSPLDATAATGDESSDEFVRLTFVRPVDTTGYELTARRPAAGDAVTVPLDGVAPVVAEAGGPVYLVGETVDPDAFAAAKAVDRSRVVVVDGAADTPLGSLTRSDVLEDDGAELFLRGDLDDDGTAETLLDRYGYGSEADRTGDWEHDFGGETEDDTAYRVEDGDGTHVDTDGEDDWFDSEAAPGDDPTAAGNLVTVEAVRPTGADTDGDGAPETTGLEVDLSNGGAAGDAVRVVGFATETDLAAGVDDADDDGTADPSDDGDAAEVAVPVAAPGPTAQDGYANDTETGAAGTFAADGTVYRFEDGGTDYDGRDAVVPGGSGFAVDVGEYRTASGDVAALGTLVTSRPAEADLTVTLLFSDGSTETVYLKQQPADVATNVTADRQVTADGGTVTFTTTVENRGPGAAPRVVLGDSYDPDDLRFESVTASAGSYDPSAGVWRLPDGLAPGAEATLSVTFRANGSVGDSLTYTSARTDSGAPDPNADNDVDTAAVGIGGADLTLTMTSSADGDGDGTVAVENGGEVRFELVVGNDGPADATGTIRVADELPDGLAYESSSATRGSYDPATGVWSFDGGLAEGATERLTVTTTASAATVNDARITDTGRGTDPDPSNNADSVAVVSGPCTSFGDPKEATLLWSTFETDGTDARDRLENAGWTASEPGVGGVNDMTADPLGGAECDQSAFHADGGTDGGAITSPTVDTRGYGLVEAAYWVRAGGSFGGSDAPEPGEDLLVEYNSSAGEWVTVDRITVGTDGVDAGTTRRVYLPGPTAKHDGFALRFRQVNTSDGANGDADATTDDYWHVDNVRVVAGPRDDGSLRPVLNDVTVSAPGCVHEDGSGDEDVDCDGDGDGSDGGDDDDGSGTNCIDSPSACTYTATFGYESTYDAPVYVASGTDANVFEVSAVDGSGARRAGNGPEAVADGPGDDDQPARPETFHPGRHDGTTRVSGFQYAEAVTYYLPADSVSAYGLVTEYAVDVRLNDDTRGSVLQGQYLEYGIRINNTGPDGTPDSGPTGESAKIRLSEGVTDVSRLTVTTRGTGDAEPVVLDTTRGDAGTTVPYDPDDGSETVGPTADGEGAYATYDPETDTVTVGGLPDDGEAVWLNVSTRLPTDEHDPLTVDAALTYRQTADPETAPADPTPGDDPDADSLTVDPLPVNCRGTIHQNGDELVLVQPLPETTSGGRVARTETFGTVDTGGDGGPGFSTSGIRLGPYRDVDDDGECEVVYLRRGGVEAQVMVMNPDGSSDPKTDVLASDADFSNTVITTADRDGDGVESVFYARNDEQALRYVEVHYGPGDVAAEHRGFVQADGGNVPSDSGVFARADTDGDGSVETFYVKSRNEWGVVEDGRITVRAGGKPFNAGYPQNATGAATLPPGVPYGEGASGSRRPDTMSGTGLGLITAAGADPIEAFDGTHGGGRVTMRDSDYDGEYEIVFRDGDGGISYYNLPVDLVENYQDDQTVTLVDEDGTDAGRPSGQGVQ